MNGNLYLMIRGEKGYFMIPRYIIDFDLETLPRKKTGVVVIGAGIAGLYTALRISEYAEIGRAHV